MTKEVGIVKSSPEVIVVGTLRHGRYDYPIKDHDKVYGMLKLPTGSRKFEDPTTLKFKGASTRLSVSPESFKDVDEWDYLKALLEEAPSEKELKTWLSRGMEFMVGSWEGLVEMTKVTVGGTISSGDDLMSLRIGAGMIGAVWQKADDLACLWVSVVDRKYGYRLRFESQHRATEALENVILEFTK